MKNFIYQNPFLKKSTFIIFFLTLSLLSFSQEKQRTCGTEEYMKQQLQQPIFAKQHAISQAKFDAELLKMKSGITQQRATLIIPVAVHFPESNENDRACLEALAQVQVDILNNDYTGTNSDISNWNSASSNYPNTNTGSTDVMFVIATQDHPINSDQDLTEGGPAVTIGFPFGNGDFDNKWSGYMNFVVRQLENGTLGYSPVGGSITNGYSVVMNLRAFGAGNGCPGVSPNSPFNLGRTVTHELGHFFNLRHTFTSSCNTDDNISDTPNISSATYNCPSAGSKNACVAGEKALTMNYMDYVDDACMYMFTEGQTARMEAYLASIASDFKPNVTLAIEDQIITETFKLWPNPSNGKIHISFNTTKSNDVNLKLFDIRGRLMSDKIYKNNSNTFNETLNFNDIDSAVYILKIKTGNNDFYRRVIIR